MVETVETEEGLGKLGFFSDFPLRAPILDTSIISVLKHDALKLDFRTITPTKVLFRFETCLSLFSWCGLVLMIRAKLI